MPSKKQLDEATAEIHRLTAANAEADAALDAAEAEIKDFKAALESSQQARDDADAALHKAKAEIERLKSDLSICESARDGRDVALAKANAEIERLRKGAPAKSEPPKPAPRKGDKVMINPGSRHGTVLDVQGDAVSVQLVGRAKVDGKLVDRMAVPVEACTVCQTPSA